MQEIEKLRELNLQAEQEKMNAVAQVRHEAKTEIVKMRDKIQEVRTGVVFGNMELGEKYHEQCEGGE